MSNFERRDDLKNPTEKKTIRNAVAAAVLPLLLLACSSEGESSASKQPSTTTETTSPHTSYPSSTLNSLPEKPGRLFFNPKPQEDFSVSDCIRDIGSHAVSIDSNPKDVETRKHTVGLATRFDEQGKPELGPGASFIGNGDYTYDVVTSNNPDKTFTVDMSKRPYAEVLEGPAANEYDAVFSMHLNPRDGNVYATVSCLSAFDYYGEMQVEPLTPDDTIPQPPTTQLAAALINFEA